jgi:hypothetical protein
MLLGLYPLDLAVRRVFKALAFECGGGAIDITPEAEHVRARGVQVRQYSGVDSGLHRHRGGQQQACGGGGGGGVSSGSSGGGGGGCLRRPVGGGFVAVCPKTPTTTGCEPCLGKVYVLGSHTVEIVVKLLA